MADSNANELKGDPVTISAPAATVVIDPQNPLPEASFLWRRLITVALCAALVGLDWYLADKLHDLGKSDDLLAFSKWNIGLLGLIVTFYFVAPSAAELTNLVQSASIIKHSLTTAAKSAENGPESPQAARFEGSGAADSQIPVEAPHAAPAADEPDAAPRGRS